MGEPGKAMKLLEPLGRGWAGGENLIGLADERRACESEGAPIKRPGEFGIAGKKFGNGWANGPEGGGMDGSQAGDKLTHAVEKPMAFFICAVVEGHASRALQ
jgi:hypothetical protein